MAFIELNPYRNSLVAHPSEYAWSSYRANALGQTDSLLSPLPRFLALGDTTESAQKKYSELVDRGLSASTQHLIRRETHRSRVIGDKLFIDAVEEYVGVSLTEKPKGGDRRSSAYRVAHQYAESFVCG